MLVLSRRPNEEILFPNIPIRICILRTQGNTVRIGIEAPPDIQVLRHEMVNAQEDRSRAPVQSPVSSHALRNHLNKVTLGLHHLQQLWNAGQIDEADRTLQRVLGVLESLERELSVADRERSAQPAKEPPFRTLLVEDDDNERELLAGILGMHGCKCATAVDGQAALEYLASHELPDLVLLDMNLPRVSGVQMLQRIRAEPRSEKLKVFAISGSSPAELGIGTGPGGVDAWFTKPLNPGRLWEAIQQGMSARAESN